MSIFQNLADKVRYNKYHVLTFGIVTLFAHPFYWFWWTYVCPNPYEDLYVRLTGSLTAVVMAIMILQEKRFKRIIPFYWIFMVIYNLPFVFTYLMIKNNLCEIWLMGEIIMIFVVILFIPSFIGSMSVLLAGILAAIILAKSTGQETIYPAHLLLSHSIIYILAIVAGYIFNLTNTMGIKAKEKSKFLEERAEIFKSLAGSIAHELRNPLNSINLVGSQISDVLKKDFVPDAKGKLVYLTSQISEAISGANNIINMILNDLSEKPIDVRDLVYLKPNQVIPQILEQYGYKNQEEKARVKFIESDNEFVFTAVLERFTFVVYNLLKNALYYLGEYPNSSIEIGAEEAIIDGVEWNVIYVRDTGPGIPSEVILKLFGDFFTSGKKGGTGLGLAFCKRNMQIFGGDIICESEVGEWTKFSLLFPKLTEAQLEEANVDDALVSKSRQSQKVKIFIVDDEKTNFLITKSKIEKNLNVVCELVNNEKEAAELESHHIKDRSLILMDIQMPEMNGVTAAKNIRALNAGIPIIAFTSLEYEDLASGDRKYFSDHLNKDVADHILHRAIAKLIPDLEDNINYLGDRDQYLPELKGKKILLADDQELNLMITSRKLEGLGLSVTQVKDGKELVDCYQKSLIDDPSLRRKKSQFDVIVTDINMPILNGDEATKQIRKIEIESGITHKNRIPIIALSGDGEKEDIRNFFNSGMNDYFIKGSDPEKLVKIIALYLSPNKIYFNKE